MKDSTKTIIKIIIFVLLYLGLFIYFIIGGLILFYYPKIEEQKDQWYVENEEYIMDARSKCFGDYVPVDSESACGYSICSKNGLKVHDNQVWAVPKVYCAEEHNSSLEEREVFDVCDIQSIDCIQMCVQRKTVLKCIEEAGADWKWRENIPK